MTDHNSIKYLLDGRDLKLPLPFTLECSKAISKIIDLNAMEKEQEICIGDFINYTTRRGDSVRAKVLTVLPKTLQIHGFFLEGERTVRVSKSKVVRQLVDA